MAVMLALAASRPSVSVDLYHRYAQSFLTRGALPPQYPAWSLLPMLLPAVLHLPYRTAFVAQMAALAAAVAILLPPSSRSRFSLYVLVGTGIIALDRYDLWPVLCTVLAWRATGRRRFTAAYLWLAIGTALKLYPLALFPFVALEERLAAGRLKPAGILGGLAATAGLLALPLLWSPREISVYAFALGRSPEAESLAASVELAAHAWGVPLHAALWEGSWNVTGPAAPVALLFALLVGVALYARSWQLRRQGRIEVPRAWLGGLAGLVLASKVFSVQYLLWLFPFAALDGAATLPWIAVGLLSTAFYPFWISLDASRHLY
ncbi:MAG: hypothetical protein M0Z27_11430, partial [Thermaerobacter sp.]|nr:hypothetical protein [Thermaerobacter sp.]